MPGGQIASPPPRPSGEWLKTWGAIASNRAGDMGVSSKQLSKREGEDEALDRCAGWNTGDCKIDLSYRNQCVAAAGATADRRGGGTASAATLERATAQAMKTCREVSGGECEIADNAGLRARPPNMITISRVINPRRANDASLNPFWESGLSSKTQSYVRQAPSSGGGGRWPQ